MQVAVRGVQPEIVDRMAVGRQFYAFVDELAGVLVLLVDSLYHIVPLAVISRDLGREIT